MSRTTKVDIVFGFQTKIELSREEIGSIRSSGLIASPLVYTTEDTATQYIIGKPVLEIQESGTFKAFTFNPSEEEKASMRLSVLDALNTLGFDVGEKTFQLFVNTYYH